MIPGNIVKPSREFGKGPDVGRSKRYAREDHDHGAPELIEAVIMAVLPYADSVEEATAFSLDPSVGISQRVAREDHQHGTPDFNPDDCKPFAVAMAIALG